MLMPDLTNPPSTRFARLTPTGHGRWDTTLQRFIPYALDFETVDAETAKIRWTNMLDLLIDSLDQKPHVKTTQNGQAGEMPPRSICCPTCSSKNVQVPLVFEEKDGFAASVTAGKGQVSCPDCGYIGTKATAKGYTMYTYADLVRERYEYLQTLKTWRETLDDILA